MRRFWPTVLLLALALLAAGCSGGDDGDRSARKAAISSEPAPQLDARLSIAGNQINVRSFSWSIDGPQAHQLQLVRLIDENSPPFFDGTAQARSYPTATLDLTDANANVVATYEFSEVVITSFANGMSAGEAALESLSLRYEKLDFTYGGVHECFDFLRQRAC